MLFCNPAQAQNFKPEEMPLSVSSSHGSKETLMIYLTGDGGMNGFSKSFIHALELQGYGVVALDSRKYFWNEKQPSQFASDLEQVAKYYQKLWNKPFVEVIGYSFGADVAAFLPKKISSGFRSELKKLVLLSPSSSTDFVIRLRDLLAHGDSTDGKYKTAPELQKPSVKITCVFGKDETLFLKDRLKDVDKVTIKEIPGDHQYQKDFNLLMKIINM
ncbi:hypothetical protein C7S20_07460 [Christiangramia fulva]|uniref:Bacterial virulence domain-containing protein n=2 Tax=Christiangramia fulva TaxID=2126553 RepID=A0A2R3Z4C2_9FLAO|nr:hypothetical protein C7S20_07460 [Christiangramia fulva]